MKKGGLERLPSFVSIQTIKDWTDKWLLEQEH